MAVAVALGASALVLITTVLRGGWVLYPLLASLALFGLAYGGRGVPLAALGQMAARGVRRSAGVLRILLLIGVLMAAWLAAGTVPTLVYYGLLWIHPRWFVVSAFGLTAAVSVLMGTAFGAAGTVGLALMIMAQGGGGHLGWVAGAIMAGAYVGDRCSPMSSSANLVATLTRTALAANLRAMARTSLWPLVLSGAIYAVASQVYPLAAAVPTFQQQIPQVFSLHGLTLLPAVAVFGLVGLGWAVEPTLVVSLAVAVGLAVAVQGYGLGLVGRWLVLGFALEADPTTDPAALAALGEVLRGGGLLPMARACAVVLVSAALAGVLTDMGTFAPLQRWSDGVRGARRRFGATVVISGLMAAYGCSQTITILLTHGLTQQPYAQDPDRHALDLADTAVVLAPLVPWNIAGLVPATLIASDARFVPFAVYLYLLPLGRLLGPQRPGG